MDRGVVYIATQEPYVSEAEQSAISLKEQHPDLHTTIFVDKDQPSDVFDDVRQQSGDYSFTDSILTDNHIVYDKTLFLDSDTHVIEPINDIFTLLDQHDVAVAHEPARDGTAGHEHDHDVPAAYPQFNTGVIGYQDNERVRALFRSWAATHHRLEGVKHNLNQPAFRIASYRWNGSIATLPPEYNFRSPYYCVGYARGPVRILHCRHQISSTKRFIRKINKHGYPRVFVMGAMTRVYSTRRPDIAIRRLLEKGLWKVKREGIESTTDDVMNYMLDQIQPYYNRFLRPYLPEMMDAQWAGITVRGRKPLDIRSKHDPHWKQGLQNAIQDHITPGDHVTIVAFGRGWSTCLALDAGAAHISAYEGSATMIEKGERTLQLNRPDQRQEVGVFHAIVGDSVDVWGQTNNVDVIHPSNLATHDVLILDCEGAEKSILEQLEDWPPTIIVESHPNLGCSTSWIESTLTSQGYTVQSEPLSSKNTLHKHVTVGTK